MNFCDLKIGEKVICNCNTPLLKRLADKVLEFIKNQNGEKVRMTLRYKDHFRVRCEKCGYSVDFIDLDNSFQIGDEVAVIKVPIAGSG